MKCFSLFSGIGGFDLALRNLGHETVGACEIDKWARQIYGKQFPNVKIWENATTINPRELPDFDILCAGFPCQAFSLAGKRLGFEDTRGTLFYEIARIAKEKRPRYLFLENVKGLLYHDSGRTFQTIISTFDELGYDLEWQVLNSKYFVPQNRERIFIIGHIRNGSVRPIFPLGEVGQLNDGSCQEAQGKGQRIQGQLSSAIDSNYKKGAGSRTMIVTDPKISGTITSTYYKGWGGDRTMIKLGNTCESHPTSQCNTVYDPDGISPTVNAGTHGYSMGYIKEDKTKMILTSHTKANIKQRIQDRENTWTLDTSGKKQGIITVSDSDKDSCRIYSDKGISRTLRANSGGYGSKTGAYEIKERIRMLTPTECERLQGFPDGWTEGLSNTQRYKCLGNAVTVPVVEYILKHF